MTAPVVCFGEVMVRLSSPPGELPLQSPLLHAHVGGAEANVAVGLCRLGGAARYVGALPSDPLGQAARDHLRRHGVDVSGLVTAPGRTGLYLVTPGSGLRPSEVHYDRAGSAFALAPPEAYDWPRLLAGAGRLHLSGITPALGEGPARATLEAARAAAERGVPVSFDGNYRARLWAGREGEAPAIVRELLSYADLALVDERDLALALERTFHGDRLERRRAAAAAAFEVFPHLQRVVATVRESGEASSLAATLFAHDGTEHAAGPIALYGVVDRIGAGDAFAAGLLFALGEGRPDAEALRFALAAGVLKHSIAGDVLLLSADAVRAAASGETADVRR